MPESERKDEELRALYPGSFDPPTRGHLDIVDRAARLFDLLYVAVLENSEKVPLFTLEERLNLLESELAGRTGVRVVSFRGLTADLARRLGARWIVRGVRSGLEAEREIAMARSNRVLSAGAMAVGLPQEACASERSSDESAGWVVDTVFLPARPELAFIESRLVREIAAGGGDLRAFVTPAVGEALRRKFRER